MNIQLEAGDQEHVTWNYVAVNHVDGQEILVVLLGRITDPFFHAQKLNKESDKESTCLFFM